MILKAQTTKIKYALNVFKFKIIKNYEGRLYFAILFWGLWQNLRELAQKILFSKKLAVPNLEAILLLLFCFQLPDLEP